MTTAAETANTLLQAGVIIDTPFLVPLSAAFEYSLHIGKIHDALDDWDNLKDEVYEELVEYARGVSNGNAAAFSNHTHNLRLSISYISDLAKQGFY